MPARLGKRSGPKVMLAVVLGLVAAYLVFFVIGLLVSVASQQFFCDDGRLFTTCPPEPWFYRPGLVLGGLSGVGTGAWVTRRTWRSGKGRDTPHVPPG